MVLFFHSFSPFLAHVWHVPLFFLLEFFLIQIRSIRGFFSYYIYIEERCWKMVDRFYFLSSLSLSLWRKWNLQRSHENLTIILAREFSISDSANPFYLKLGNSILGPPPRKNSLFHSRGCSTASPSSSPLFKERKHRFSSLSMLKVERWRFSFSFTREDRRKKKRTQKLSSLSRIKHERGRYYLTRCRREGEV